MLLKKVKDCFSVCDLQGMNLVLPQDAHLDRTARDEAQTFAVAGRWSLLRQEATSV